MGIAFDGAGNLYVANDLFPKIMKFNADGVGSPFASFSGFAHPTGLAFDSAGNLFVADSFAGGGEIVEYTPDGSRYSIFASSGLSSPSGLAFDRMGNLYVANQGDNTIEKFTPEGVGSVFASSGLSSPTGLAFDSAGNLYVANQGNSSIDKFAADGSGSVFATFATAGQLLFQPRFLAFTDDTGVPLPLANQVPEPASLVLLVIGSLGCLARRRRL
jgi:DNA-binding beta-propeller fold protein YncE